MQLQSFSKQNADRQQLFLKIERLLKMQPSLQRKHRKLECIIRRVRRRMGCSGHLPVRTRITFPNVSNILAIPCGQYENNVIGDKKEKTDKYCFAWGLLRRYFQTMYGFKGCEELGILLPSVYVLPYWRNRHPNNGCSTESAR